MQRIIRRSEVEHIVGLKRAMIYRLIQAGEFPRPVRIGGGKKNGGVGWVEAEIAEFIDRRIAERDAAA